MNAPMVTDWITTIAACMTVVVVAWYTYETWRLRKEAQLQTELGNRPFLSVITKATSLSEPSLGFAPRHFTAIANIGKGLARSISIAVVRIGDGGIELRSPSITHLMPGDDLIPPWRVFSRLSVSDPLTEDPGSDHRTMAAAILSNPQSSYTISVTYVSIVGQHYATTIGVKEGGREIEILADSRTETNG